MTTQLAPEPGPAAGDLLALDRQVCFALAVASRNVIALYRPLLHPMGLTHPQYLVMLALWEQAPLRVSEIAERLSLEPATLSPLLKRLETAGHVRRDRDPRDERVVAVSLTPAGRRLRRRAERIPPAVLARLGMDIGDLEDIRDRLTGLIDATRNAT
ncbi:MarR family winged helix-turn-helix transcriptional regulator [Phycicoccus duodecadis]|uniref:MarR family winged helix-turn-helix transcriptional regulator n=1 Tax=Phycicoccus duodecadis TaxID=173053 RepID=UPI001FEB9836|nr:MarR family transcriptional regulator [Phycicoccus duodecadis]